MDRSRIEEERKNKDIQAFNQKKKAMQYAMQGRAIS
jgi:hypothetical protein